MKLSNPNVKKIQEGTFQARKMMKTHPEEISYTSGNGTF